MPNFVVILSFFPFIILYYFRCYTSCFVCKWLRLSAMWCLCADFFIIQTFELRKIGGRFVCSGEIGFGWSCLDGILGFLSELLICFGDCLDCCYYCCCLFLNILFYIPIKIPYYVYLTCILSHFFTFFF